MAKGTDIHTCWRGKPIWPIISAALVFFTLNCLNYFILTVDFRATSLAIYSWSAASNYVAAVLGFYIIKRIANPGHWLDVQGYAIGGVVGNILGIAFTQWVWSR
jgi:hypothetical protein